MKGIAARASAVEIVEVDARARGILARRHHQLSGPGKAVIVVVADESHEQIFRVLEQIVDATNRGERLTLERLIDELTPATVSTRSALADEARRRAQMRTRIIRDFGAFSAPELSDIGGSRTTNRSQLAYRWRKEGRIFSVRYRSAKFYLTFQFDEDLQPLPVIAEILEAFTGWDEWRIARWFVVSNGLLNKARPVDLLTVDPTAVVRAALADASRREARS